MSKYADKSAQELVQLLVAASDVLDEEDASRLVDSSKDRAISLLETYDRNLKRRAALARSRERLREVSL